MIITEFSKDIQVRLLDDLVKVFPDEAPMASVEPVSLSVLRDDRLSFQIAFSGRLSEPEQPGHFPTRFAQITVSSPVSDWITVREVICVPCEYPAHADSDDNYLRKNPGLYPDLLRPVEAGIIPITDNRWSAVWIDAETPADCIPGRYPLEICLSDPRTSEKLLILALEINVLSFTLPSQLFPRTEWFHADCLADYYHVPVFSEEHWAILRSFIAAAVRRGINMILVPQFTPPLDTGVGRERTTVQLVDVFSDEGVYRFDFSKLRRWIGMCLECGVRYFEMSHLFSQWGAVAAPKIEGYVGSVRRRIFGWDTPATGSDYTSFLRAYLPQLRAVLRECGIEDRTYFHISDEPHLDQMKSYRAAKESIRDLLGGCRFLEALSDYEFYKHGLIEHPVCATDHIDAFLQAETPGLWSYYCTSQSKNVSNCFIAQPSGRTRIYGLQLYKFGIEGSLRWGYNFYNSAFSYYPVNPFLSTDCGRVMPSGDPFLVYPGPGGVPQESIRMLVLDDAIRDLRALKALEEKIGRKKTIAILDEGLITPLTFDRYPRYPEDAPYVLRLRRQVNQMLCE